MNQPGDVISIAHSCVHAHGRCQGEDLYWYAVSSKPHQEALAESSLRHLSIETFSPLIQDHRLVRGKQQVRVAPLFPGYLFARFNLDHSYRAVCYARGVKRVVSFGQDPAIVDDAMIDGLRARLECGIMLSSSHFQPGQVVRIASGALNGLEAIFEKELTGSQRAVLLLRALSFQARVVVELKQIVNL
jgi:transcriptional antiterminator RfaH